ncbi:MAG: GerMN domain-containing protein [Anaerolineaceae bacterium]|nr:GerMN domain-containing protein [Anaerolineaceae bacterium]
MGAKIFLTILAVALIQAACSVSAVEPMNATHTPSSSAVISTETLAPIANTITPAASESPVPATMVPSAIPSPASLDPNATNVSGASTVKIFMVAINDNGVRGPKIGCGDSIIPVDVPITPTLGVLRAALTKLLSAKTRYFGGESDLYDSLYQSNLNIDSLDIQNGVATIRLSGTVLLGGVCDAPRFQAQIEQTALQFSTIKQVSIFINDKPLSEVLSSK